jgi:hypothetical protein
MGGGLHPVIAVTCKHLREDVFHVRNAGFGSTEVPTGGTIRVTRQDMYSMSKNWSRDGFRLLLMTLVLFSSPEFMGKFPAND